MKKSYILLLLLLAISVFLIACDEPSASEDGSSSETTEASGEEEQTDESSDEESSDLNLGETTEIEDLTFTAKSARWDDGNEFDSPEEGNRYLVIDAEITNNSDENITISSMLMFALYDDENYSTELAIFADTKGSLDGDLASGKAMAGEIAFEVPESSQNFEFIFEPNIIGSGQVTYAIDASEVQ